MLEAFGADGVLERKFAPGVQVPAQAGLLDQILAMLGRSPSWPR